jgi:hypothetical protein
MDAAQMVELPLVALEAPLSRDLWLGKTVMTTPLDAGARISCATCRFYLKHEPQHVYGDCRRSPPQFGFYANFRDDEYPRKQFRVEIQRERGGTWPNISQDDWCGEYQPAVLAILSEQGA